jgi:ankyrin repeat protein
MNWFELAKNGKVEEMKELLENKQYDVDFQDDTKWTALMYAASYSNATSNIETVKLLLESGANVNLQNDTNSTALMIAARYSNTTSNLETVKFLLESGANVNIQNDYGWTALMLAARNSNTNSNIETVKLLLESGANVNLQNDTNSTALMMAAKNSNTNSNIETVKLLLESGANVNLQDNTNSTALMYSARYSNTDSNVETVKLLLEYEADPFPKSQENKSALDYCPTKECKETIAKEVWKRLYKTDKMVADKLNKRIPVGKDVWEIIMLNKRQQTLCQNLSSNKNLEVLIEFALEFGIPLEKIKTMNKGQLCGTISRYLAYGKNASIEKIERERREIFKFAKEYGKKFGIDTNQPIEKILEELSKIY